MTTRRWASLAETMVLMALFGGLLAAEEGAAPAAHEPPEAAPEVAAAATEAMVEMAEFVPRQGRHVEGRIVYEDEERIDLERPDGSVTGYRKELIPNEIRRFTISQVEWIERGGDLSQEKALESSEPPVDLMKSLHAYQRALALADGPEERQRLEAKAGAVRELQDAWHTESRRRQELEIMKQEAELLKLERQLTSQKLEALEEQEAELRRLRADLDRTRAESRRLVAVAEDLALAVAELEEEMDELRYLDRVFVRTNVFIDLKEEHEDLERRVRRLQARIRD